MEAINLLCSREIPQEAKDFAHKNNIAIDVLNFIETFPVANIEVQQEVETALQLSTVVVFTSMNAVQYVASLAADENPDWIIYCIGPATLALVQKYFPNCKVAATAKEANALSEKIITDNIADTVYFFCGNKRRDALPLALEDAGIEVIEIVVYETLEMHHTVTKNYDAVLFFSPSAVRSFFATNKLQTTSKLFAIGETTAASAAEYFDGEIIIGDATGKLNLVTEAINYFI